MFVKIVEIYGCHSKRTSLGFFTKGSGNLYSGSKNGTGDSGRRRKGWRKGNEGPEVGLIRDVRSGGPITWMVRGGSCEQGDYTRGAVLRRV